MGYYAFDFDGTLFTHLKGGGVAGYGAPITPMIQRLKAFLAKGDQVRIITARIRTPSSDDPDMAAVQLWNAHQRQLVTQALATQGIKPLQVQAHKCFQMLMLYDDRCVQVETNTGRVAGEEPEELARYLGVEIPDRSSANS